VNLTTMMVDPNVENRHGRYARRLFNIVRVKFQMQERMKMVLVIVVVLSMWRMFSWSPSDDLLASYGIVLFTPREFARVCCDFGPTRFEFRNGFERGVCDYRKKIDDFRSFRMNRPISVYVAIIDLPQFINDFFMKLSPEESVVLITGQEDFGPCELFNEGRLPQSELVSSISLKSFLADTRLKHWFAQNHDVDRSCDSSLTALELHKIEALPIGVDYHTRAEKTFFPFFRVSPAKQEEELIKHSRKWLDKPLSLLALFQRDSEKPERGILLDHLEPMRTCVVKSNHRLSESESWILHGDAAFVLCPQGRGIDTHRLYEALALGSVPVVLTSTLDTLYSELPIIILKSLKSFPHCDTIRKWKVEIIQRFGQDPFSNYNEVTLKNWKDRINKYL